MTESTSRDPLIGTLLDDRYVIERRVARGGMSTVYVAKDSKLLRQVAIKVLYPHLAEDPSFVRRFESEAITAARLSHPHVVSVFDQGVDGETAYLVLEYVPGATLRDVLRTQGAISPRAALQVTDAVLSGLAAAHDAGLVHRDVKPENVLLSPDGRIKVADFGLARAASAHTATGALIGTVAYVSPELVTGRPADSRSDLYALGVLLYEMLTGTQPFSAETAWQVAMAHVNSEVPAPSDKVEGLSPELDDLVRWSTEQDPEDRPNDAAAMLSELRHIRSELTPEQLDLGEDPTPIGPLLTATLAVMGRDAARRLPGAAAPAALGGTAAAAGAAALAASARSGSGDASEAATRAFGQPASQPGAESEAQTRALDQSEAATQALGESGLGASSSGASASEDKDADSSEYGDTDAATQVFDAAEFPTAAMPSTPGSTLGSGSAGAAASADTDEDSDAPFDWEAPTTPIQHSGDPVTRQTASQQPSYAADPQTQVLPGPAASGQGMSGQGMSGQGSSEQGAPGAGASAGSVLPRLPRETCPVEPEQGANLSKREQRAEAKAWKKEAQRPTERLGTSGAKRRGWIWAVVVVIVAALIGTGAWFFGAGPGGEVIVPTVQGQSVDAAKAALSAEGVSVTEQEVFDEKLEAGQVIGTDPPAGSSQRKFNSVQLLVSKGPELFRVPNVVGYAQKAAAAKLTKANLAPGKVTRDWDESAPKGQVIKQGTAADKELRSGSKVALVLSKGPAPVAVPELNGRSAEDAKELLEAVQLDSVQGDDVFSDTVPAGQIAEQSTKAGTKVNKGSKVTWQLSKGPELVEVPKVTWRSPAAARKTLEDAGFKVKENVSSLGRILNQVISQSPKAGTKVKPGTEITIGIS
ncbi:Stk1 family PASTA domain-containing Ser/Thr kinase [Galactobacter caseinivorans]|uniref:non-specific serine/threonine protein kinase n=1 Tax=Galactobacter caseinivorans TaxID=2676123 RepID=A0A496PKF5_9MICC|nr:Stk1 family PASTA domain-containing Ser/Thr kinase [Galactobacter caseinivorans]RKW70992.1 serine/threonine-protein kinase [Galactobacter caseinivorans]